MALSTAASKPHAWHPNKQLKNALQVFCLLSTHVSKAQKSAVTAAHISHLSSSGRAKTLPGAGLHPCICAAAATAGDQAPDTATADAATLWRRLNEVSNTAIQVMLRRDEAAALQHADHLEQHRLDMLLEGSSEADAFLAVLQGMLHHTIIRPARPLEGPYLTAFNRICNTIQGCGWKLSEAGKSAEVDDQPKFKSWEEVLGAKKEQQQGSSSSSSSSSSTEGKHQGSQAHDHRLYQLLGVASHATLSEIKSAYRHLALKWHPDVSNAEDASVRFAELSAAYDVLSDPESRKLYDERGMQSYSGAAAGKGNATDFWDEIKPYKRKNKHTAAREASAASAMPHDASNGQQPPIRTGLDGQQAMPRSGDVVEYPLSDHVKADLQDGRLSGVGLLVSRNLDRADARVLPPEVLPLCEIEPLRQQEPGSDSWIVDELAVNAYCILHELTRVEGVSYDRRYDVWVIQGSLSAGCGGPEIVQELML